MTIRTRFTFLIGAVILAFTVGAVLLGLSHREEAEDVLASLRRERSDLLDRQLQLFGQPLRTFAEDYGQWDEMLAFATAAAPDPRWAAINIDASLDNFKAQAAWVLRADGTTCYGVERLGDPAWREFPLREERFLAQLRAGRNLHFFLRSASGVVEIRTAPVLASADSERKGEAQGWLIAGRLWDAPFVARLGDALQSRIRLSGSHELGLLSSRIHLDREFTGWDGSRIALLHLDYEPRALLELLESNQTEILVYTGMGATVLLLVVVGVYRWVLTPLGRFSRSMETGRIDPAQGMLRRADEYGHLAQLMERSFQQRDTLTREVEERRRAEQMLRENEAQMRDALELRRRLARDLHDGVIQSIYAAGLGLEAARADLRETAPAEAEAKLTACQRSLNQTIAEVRNFILGLEPAAEPAERQAFPHALASLAATLRSLHPVDIQLEVEPGAAGSLRPAQEIHLLQIAREAVANALRHGQARQVVLALRGAADGAIEFEVRDNGAGFDPAQARRGSGLANLSARALELRAAFAIDSAPGKGTRLAFRISPAVFP
jgi:signal transduction histidine kinase